MFDPVLADVAVVRREGPRWRLDVLRFTGDVLATTPLHIDGSTPVQGRRRPQVLTLAARLLENWNTTVTGDWDEFEGAWSVALVVRSPENRMRTPAV
ncbi:hypothetical protein [Herbiconiux liangxiaofengii]|uniref:hypothetical protein n=1 Tax=Herbiconiux liangxiaofengii TaxID=3342795 RepID=UPI0035B7DDB6